MSLFNRPAWAKSQTPTGSDQPEANIFSHSDRSYRDIIAEQERKKQARLERKKAKEERRSSAKRDFSANDDEDTAFKKRRVSIEDGLDNDAPALSRSNASVDGYEDAAGAAHEPPMRRSPCRPHHEPTAVVELGSSDEEVAHQATKASLPPVEILDDESDDEFAELARRAREERLQRGDQGKKPQTSDLASHSRSPQPGSLDTGQNSLPTPPPDPPVQLFITSRLPDTREMIVYRKLSQNLADVRKVWCNKQGMTEEQMRDVFFIHRMRRVYDVTTCKSLGLEVDSFGNLTLEGAEDKGDVDRIHLEAVTDAIFKQIKAEKAQEQQANTASADANANGDEPEVEQPHEESLIRLVLKANKQEDFKLKVKPTTTVSKIIDAFTKKRLQEGESAYLMFDGERLDPNNEVQDTDISDMDCIEVHISSG